MKGIVDYCTRDIPTNEVQDCVKLRLRGVGSGFKEGPAMQESNEQLHLCVSSKFYDKYLMACDECEALIQSVY